MGYWGISLFLVLMVSLAPENAHAYLDPGTGSMLAQLVIGALAGLVFAIKLNWRRMTVFLSGVAKKIFR